MKILVLSDTHIPERAKCLPDVVCEELKKVDLVIHAGDFADISVVEVLKKHCAQVKCICGNMDPVEIKKKFPEKDIFELNGFKIGLIHGYGPPNKLLDMVTQTFKKDKLDLVIFGHSHFPYNNKENGTIYFNPGSATDEIFAPYKSFGIIDIDKEITCKIVKI